MKKVFLLGILALGLQISGLAQTKTGAFDPAAATRAIKEQAAKMGAAFMKKDYKTFSHYTYPKLLTMMGGEAKMGQVLDQAFQQMQSSGMEMKAVSVGEPGKVVKAGNGYQSTIPQHLEIKMADGKITTTTTLVAFSADNGHNWTFMDTSNKDMATIRKMLPELSPSINIPPAQPPVRSAN